MSRRVQQTGEAASHFTAQAIAPSPQYTYLFRNPGKAPLAPARLLCDDLTAVPTPAGDSLRRVSRSSSPTLGPGGSAVLPNILFGCSERTAEPGDAQRSFSNRTVARCQSAQTTLTDTPRAVCLSALDFFTETRPRPLERNNIRIEEGTPSRQGQGMPCLALLTDNTVKRREVRDGRRKRCVSSKCGGICIGSKMRWN